MEKHRNQLKSYMKKIILSVVVLSLFAFTSIKLSSEKATAEANQVQGIFIFTDSKPTAEYEYLGTVSTATIVWKTRGYEDIRETLLKKLKKDYPNADGAIFNFTGGKDKVDAIKFK